jgi:hypothetical protein
MGDDDHRCVDRGPPAPAVGVVVQATTDEERAGVRQRVAEERGAGLGHAGLPAGEVLDGDRPAGVPAEELLDAVVGVSDEPVDRHRQVCDHACHLVLPPIGDAARNLAGASGCERYRCLRRRDAEGEALHEIQVDGVGVVAVVADREILTGVEEEVAAALAQDDRAPQAG